MANILETAKFWIAKGMFGLAQLRGNRIPIAPSSPNYSNGAKCVFGVTLSGGEFTPGGTYPGNYGYPSRESVDYYASRGMGVIRFPFLWERVQPTPNSPLSDVEMALIDPMIEYAISKGLKVCIDPHNGGYGYGAIIGNKDCPDSWFEDLWTRLALRYMHHGDKVIFMLMSEPHDQCPVQWFRSANLAIDAIRKVGASQTIVIPGTFFDGAWLWTLSGNSYFAKSIHDPLNNYMFEVHQYLDADGSGSTDKVVRPTIGADRLYAVTQWARKTGNKLFLGEFATGFDADSIDALARTLEFIVANTDVWKYACWWGAGDRWMNYFFSIEPSDYANPTDDVRLKMMQGVM